MNLTLLIEALEKQRQKLIEQSNSELAEVNDHAAKRDFYMTEAKLIYTQIEAIKNGQPIEDYDGKISQKAR